MNTSKQRIITSILCSFAFAALVGTSGCSVEEWDGAEPKAFIGIDEAQPNPEVCIEACRVLLDDCLDPAPPNDLLDCVTDCEDGTFAPGVPECIASTPCGAELHTCFGPASEEAPWQQANDVTQARELRNAE